MTIHKIVYIAQAEYLTIYDKPLFAEDFQAWVWGPVIPELYSQYKPCNSREPILLNIPAPKIPQEIATFLDSVFANYIDINRFTLSDLIRGNLEPDDRSQEIIPKNLIRDYYQKILIDKEQSDDLEIMSQFVDFLIKDSRNNPEKLVPYTEEMLKQDRQLLDSIFS